MVSIVIPVYNSGSFLNKCLNSVLRQTYEDWEVVLVDDCSTDGRTKHLLKKWIKRDSRIHLVNKVHNEGIEKARFTGINHVHGEFLMFMDHDDYFFANDVIETMMDNMLKTGADVVMGRSYEQKLFFRARMYDSTPCGVIGQPALQDKYYVSFFGVNLIPCLVWGKIYKMSVIREAKPRPCGLRDTDDVNFNMWVFPYVRLLSVIDKFVYVHRWGGFSSKLIDFIPEYKRLYRERRKAICEFHYTKALMPINVNMKNLLFFDLSLKIERKNYKQTDVFRYLKEELNDTIWSEVMELNDNDEFTEALRRKDYVRMDSIVRKPLEAPKRRIVNFLKKIGRPLLRCLTDLYVVFSCT